MYIYTHTQLPGVFLLVKALLTNAWGDQRDAGSTCAGQKNPLEREAWHAQANSAWRIPWTETEGLVHRVTKCLKSLTQLEVT